MVDLQKTWRYAFVLFLVVTMSVGAFLRVFLAGHLDVDLVFPYWRHAHAHLGYYGVLFPMVFFLWPQKQPRWVQVVYLMAVTISFFGFVLQGYRVVAIAASTVIGIVWLYAAFRNRTKALYDLQGAILPGIIAAELCIPPIAIFVRSDPALSQRFVATFLSTLLFAVLLPSVLRGVRFLWPVFVTLAIGAAFSLGVWPHIQGRLFLGFFAVALFWVGWQKNDSLAHRAAFAFAALGMVSMAFGIMPNTHSVVLGAVHFLILGPLLMTGAKKLVAFPITFAWPALVAASSLALPLALMDIWPQPYWADAAMAGGILVLCIWLFVIGYSIRRWPATLRE